MFFSLRISDIYKTTDDCVVISFDVPADIQKNFSFIQGQYLTLDHEIEGQRVRRSYSLCSSPGERAWKIGIKKVEGGVFSSFANDCLSVGDTLKVSPPQGKFYVDLDTRKKRSYVAFAAGSGITPILSIIKTHLETEKESSFTLFFVNQKARSIILKEELEAIKNQYLDRFNIYYLLTRQNRSVNFLNGRINDDKLDYIFEHILQLMRIDHFFICGPENMILNIRDYLISHGVLKEQIHFELFGTNASRQASELIATKEKHKGKSCVLTVTEGGHKNVMNVERGGGSVLDQALQNGSDLPYACKGGVCCTCRAKLIKGKVEMAVSYGLEEEEIENGYILTCQAIPTSSKVEINFDV